MQDLPIEVSAVYKLGLGMAIKRSFEGLSDRRRSTVVKERQVDRNVHAETNIVVRIE